MVDADDDGGECGPYSESLLPPSVVYTAAASLVLLSVSVTVAWCCSWLKSAISGSMSLS